MKSTKYVIYVLTSVPLCSQFEGGIYTTSLVVEGSYALAAAAKKAPTLKPVS